MIETETGELNPELGHSARTEQVVTLVLEGELLQPELSEVVRELQRLEQRGRIHVLLDLTDVTHLNFRGVPPLVARAQAMRREGGDLQICGASPYLRAIFAASGAHGVFEYFPSVESARERFAVARRFS